MAKKSPSIVMGEKGPVKKKTIKNMRPTNIAFNSLLGKESWSFLNFEISFEPQFYKFINAFDFHQVVSCPPEEYPIKIKEREVWKDY